MTRPIAKAIKSETRRERKRRNEPKRVGRQSRLLSRMLRKVLQINVPEEAIAARYPQGALTGERT